MKTKKVSKTETPNAEGAPALRLDVPAPAAEQAPREGTQPATVPLVGMRETFTADSVTIEAPGSSIRHERWEIEGWLAAMNIVRRSQSDEACREEVARTVNSNKDAPSAFRSLRLAVLALVAAAAGLLTQPRSAAGSEIIRGYAPVDGQQLYAADLDNLVDESVIGAQFYNDQQTTPVLGAGYYFLVLNPANQTYYRINAQQVLYGNTNLFINAPPEGVPAYGLLLFFDPTNGWVASTTVSNFLWNSASNINVAGLSFANTNNGGATNAFVLPRWPYPALTGLPPGGTNFPAHFLIFDTNGIPYREGLSNLEVNVASDMGTYFALPWEYEQEFAPWRIYGTNSVAPFTNAFGWATNFPITAYFQTNKDDSQTNATLTDGDTIPVNSVEEGGIGVGPTNTSATLLSIYEYMTNKNALPPYTIARTQFSGIPATALVTNMNAISGIVTNIALAINWTNPTPVSFMGASPEMPTVPTITSNVVYWAYVTNAPPAPSTVPCFQLFSSFANAEARVSPITGNGVNGVNASTLFYLTNDTAVNCVAIQESGVSAKQTGVYGLWFTNIVPTSAFYYLTGSVLDSGNTGNGGGYLSISGTQPPTTATVNVGTWLNNTTPTQYGLVQALLQPQ